MGKKPRFIAISAKVKNKSTDQIKAFWYRSLKKINSILEAKNYKIDTSNAHQTVPALLCYYSTQQKPEHQPLRLNKKPYLNRFRMALHTAILRATERNRKKLAKKQEQEEQAEQADREEREAEEVARREEDEGAEAEAEAAGAAMGLSPSLNGSELEHQRKKQLFQQRHNDSPPVASNGRARDTSPPSTMSSVKGSMGKGSNSKGKAKGRGSKGKAALSSSSLSSSSSGPAEEGVGEAPVAMPQGIVIPPALISAFLLGTTSQSETLELQLVPRTVKARDAMARAGCDTMLRLDIQRTSYVRKLVKHYSKVWRAAAPPATPNAHAQLRVWPAGDRSGHPGYGLDDASVTVGDICDRLFVTRPKLKLEYDWTPNVCTPIAMGQHRMGGRWGGILGNSAGSVASMMAPPPSYAVARTPQPSGGETNVAPGSAASVASASSSSPFSQSSAFFKAHEIESEVAVTAVDAKRRRLTPQLVS
jgi:hypothetical protein